MFMKPALLAMMLSEFVNDVEENMVNEPNHGLYS